MPFFSEGQDPLAQANLAAPGRLPQGQPAPDPFAGPLPSQTLGAAFRLDNPVVSVLDAVGRGSADLSIDPTYDPIPRVMGSKYEPYLNQFLADRNPGQTNARMAKIDSEQADQQTLAASGTAGTVASLAAGALDPSWFVPILGEVHAYGEGLSIAARVARGAVEGLGKSAISESALQASQVTRTPGEAVANIATNTVLMGLIGGGSAWLSGAERTGAVEGLERMRTDLSGGEGPKVDLKVNHAEDGFAADATRNDGTSATYSTIKSDGGYSVNRIERDASGQPLEGQSGPLRLDASIADVPHETPATFESPRAVEAFVRNVEDGRPAPASAPPIAPDGQTAPRALAYDLSAAASDQRDMQLSRIGLPANIQDALRQVPGLAPALDWVTAANMRFSPTLRIFSSGSIVAKRAMGDLAETALRFTQSERGITTARGGVPIDRLVKMQAHNLKLTNGQILRDQFLKYRQVDAKTRFPVAQTALADMRGQAPGQLSYADFKREVTLAASSGDAHAIPEVAQAARQVRAQILDPIAQMAQRTLGPDGKPMLGEALEPPKGDKSFFPRQWNKQAIAAKYNQAKKTFSDWLENEQSVKAAAKDRIADLQAKHEALANQVDKLDGRLETIKGKQEDTAAALKERGMETNRATDREDTLEERNAKIDAGVAEVEQFLAESKSAVDAHDADPFDREQYAQLQREVQALKASKGRNNIRLNEAGVPVSASQSRFMDLADRMTRQQVMEDLLTKARGAAEDQRLAVRSRMEAEIRNWKGNTTGDAVAALKARDEAERVRGLQQQADVYRGKGERFTAADGPVDRAVKSILASDRDLSRDELESRAAEILDRINAAPDGRIPYDIANGGPQMGVPSDKQQVRGSLNARDFAIPTSLVKDFINTDTEHVISSHLRTMIPDIHLTDRFGDVDMTDVFRRLNEEYDAKRSAVGDDQKKLTALDKERKAMNRDLAASRDRIRGVYGWELAKTQPNAARIANVARTYNLIADLGTSVFNRMTDSVNGVYRHGFMGVLGDGYLPFFKSLTGMEKGFAPAAKQSMHDMGVGIDSAIGHLSHQFGDVLDDFQPGSKFERALAWSADKSMLLNLHGPWTDAMKTIGGTVAAANMLRTASRVAGASASAKDMQLLAQAGIEPFMATRIWDAFSKDGGQTFGKGTHVANTASWTDEQARQVFSSAVARDADMSVLTPGLEKPLWMSSPVVSLLGQYKSFVAAAHEKLLISNLQQMDARTLQGLAASLGMGMLSYRAYTLLSGAPASDRPQDWIKEGISRSAILGWYSELNSMQAKFTGGATDMFRAIGADHPLSRRSTNGALSEMLGPTYAKLEGLAQGLNDASHQTWTASDTHKLRQAVFFQNLFAVRRLFDQAEDGFNEHLGIKPMNRDPAMWPGQPPH